MSMRRPPRDGGASATAGAPTSALARLCAALLPVLRARDVDGFRAALDDAADLLGDTSELQARSDDGLRAIMSDMLREPRRFGLPPWPREQSVIAEAPPPREPAPREPPSAPPTTRREGAPAARPDRAPAPTATARPSAEASVYPPAAVETASLEPEPAAVNLSLPGFGTAVRPVPRPRRRLGRRPRGEGGEQLRLWDS